MTVRIHPNRLLSCLSTDTKPAANVDPFTIALETDTGKIFTTVDSGTTWTQISLSVAQLIGSLSLTTQVTGTLPVANGGTGAATLTGILKGNGTSAVTAAAQLAVADGGTGAATLTGILKGNGTSAVTASNTLAGITLTTPTINGVIQGSVSKVTGDSPYTATATVRIINIDNSAGSTDFVLNLPTAVGITGTMYTIIRTDIILSANKTLITPNGSETIDGVATNYRLWPGEKMTIVSDGTNWISIDRPTPSIQGYYFTKGATVNRYYYAGTPLTNAALQVSTTSPAINTLWALPFVVSKVTKFSKIIFNITTLQASQNARAGIYHDNGNVYPGTLLFDTGSISTGTTGQKATTITAGLQTFQPGLYWLAWETDANAIQLKILPIAPNCYALLSYLGTSSAENGYYALSVAHTYGALPDPYTAGATYINTSSAVSTPIPALALQAV